MEDSNLLIKYVNVNLLQSEVIVLRDVNLEVRKGEFIYLIGKVGSGKSTLLKSFYAEVPIDSGEEACIFDYDLKKIKRSKIPYLRRQLGIIYQDFQLLTDRTVHDNLSFVLKATGWRKKDAEQRITEVLTQVGMENKGYKMPHQLSGGEQQRIVIARALLNKPAIILADEPTGHLDVETGDEIIKLLREICSEGTTVIMSTHNLQLLQQYPARTLRFENEHMMDDRAKETPLVTSQEETTAQEIIEQESETNTSKEKIATQEDIATPLIKEVTATQEKITPEEKENTEVTPQEEAPKATIKKRFTIPDAPQA